MKHFDGTCLTLPSKSPFNPPLFQIAEDFTEQKVKDVVVTVPVYFSQSERKALMHSVELAGLTCLQVRKERE